jgi:hypothetical protein
MPTVIQKSSEPSPDELLRLIQIPLSAFQRRNRELEPFWSLLLDVEREEDAADALYDVVKSAAEMRGIEGTACLVSSYCLALAWRYRAVGALVRRCCQFVRSVCGPPPVDRQSIEFSNGGLSFYQIDIAIQLSQAARKTHSLDELMTTPVARLLTMQFCTTCGRQLYRLLPELKIDEFLSFCDTIDDPELEFAKICSYKIIPGQWSEGARLRHRWEILSVRNRRHLESREQSVEKAIGLLVDQSH